MAAAGTGAGVLGDVVGVLRALVADGVVPSAALGADFFLPDRPDVARLEKAPGDAASHLQAAAVLVRAAAAGDAAFDACVGSGLLLRALHLENCSNAVRDVSAWHVDVLATLAGLEVLGTVGRTTRGLGYLQSVGLVQNLCELALSAHPDGEHFTEMICGAVMGFFQGCMDENPDSTSGEVLAVLAAEGAAWERVLGRARHAISEAADTRHPSPPHVSLLASATAASFSTGTRAAAADALVAELNVQALQRLAAVAVAAHDDDLKAFCMHELAKIVGCGGAEGVPTVMKALADGCGRELMSQLADAFQLRQVHERLRGASRECIAAFARTHHGLLYIGTAGLRLLDNICDRASVAPMPSGLEWRRFVLGRVDSKLDARVLSAQRKARVHDAIGARAEHAPATVAVATRGA